MPRSVAMWLADKDTTMSEIGDEPFQMHSKFDDIYVAVDAKRVIRPATVQSLVCDMVVTWRESVSISIISISWV